MQVKGFSAYKSSKLKIKTKKQMISYVFQLTKKFSRSYRNFQNNLRTHNTINHFAYGGKSGVHKKHQYQFNQQSNKLWTKLNEN